MKAIFAHQQFIVFALLAVFIGCSDEKRATLAHQTTIEISRDLPLSLRNAVLNIHIREPIDLLVVNFQSWGGNYSLNYPSGSGSSTYGTNKFFEEHRLIAVDTNGFKILFTRVENNVVQTNCILFRFGEITQTNTLGWRIVGKFK